MPIGVLKSHIIKSFKNSYWMSIGIGYAFGGTSLVNEIERDSRISTLRFGIVASLLIYRMHTLKLMIISARRFEQGADFDSFSIAYQYVWNHK